MTESDHDHDHDEKDDHNHHRDHDQKDDHDDDDGDGDHVELRLKDRAKVFPVRIISMTMIVKIMGILGMTNKMICLDSKRIFPSNWPVGISKEFPLKID